MLRANEFEGDIIVSRARRAVATARSKLAREDLNFDSLNQNQGCYHYTTGQ